MDHMEAFILVWCSCVALFLCQLMFIVSLSDPSRFCNTGCADSWMGDRYCDTVEDIQDMLCWWILICCVFCRHAMCLIVDLMWETVGLQPLTSCMALKSLTTFLPSIFH